MDRPDCDGTAANGDGTDADGTERDGNGPQENGRDESRSESLPAETPEGSETETPSEQAPGDLVLRFERRPLLVRVLATYARRLWALLVVAALPAAPVVLLSQVLLVAPARDGVYLNGILESATEPLTAPTLITAGILLVLGLGVAPITLGGATLLGAAALLGRRISPRQAWREALRRYFTVLTWLLLLITLLVGYLALFLWALFSEWPPVFTGIVLLLILAVPLVPLTVSLPLALLEGHGPFRAFVEAWRLARQRFGTHLLLVGLSYGVSALAGTGLERALISWTDLAEGAPALSAITLAAGVLVAPLSLLLACAPVVYSGVGNPFVEPVASRYDERGKLVPVSQEEAGFPDRGPARDLDLVRVGAQLPEPPTSPSGRDSDSVFGGPRVLVVPALVLAVFGPPLLGPGLLAANPFGLPEMAAHPVRSLSGDELSVDIDPADEAVVGIASTSVDVELCDPECRNVHEGDHTWKGSGVWTGDGGVMWTVWRELEHVDGPEEERYDPHPESGLYLRSCADAKDCAEPDEEVQVRQYMDSQHDSSSAVTPLADGRLLIATYVRRYDPPELESTLEEDRGGLRLHVCEDASCSEQEVVLFPPEMTAGGFLTDGDFLTPAASPGGGYAVAVTDTVRGTLSVVACEEEACTDPEVAEIRASQFRSEHESRLRGRFGARIEYREDGTPAIAYRNPQGGRAHLVDCHDALCTEFTDTAVTGPGWARPAPGLAIDSQDRAHLLTPDFTEERLALLTCLDRECSETESTALVELTGSEPSQTALVLDDQDRPHMVWGHGEARTRFMGGTDFESEAEYLRCDEPLCGAPVT
ncbi:hypothetical protein [Nocardiopsis oceani]